MNLSKNKNNWLPPTSFEEKIKHIIIPSRLYIRRLVLKEWIKGRKDIRILKYLINKEKNSIDVGAYKGVYTYFLAKYSKKVYAFEPNPKSYKILRKTVNKNVEVLPYALSDKSSSDFLKIPKGKKGYSNQGGSIRNVKLDKKFEKNLDYLNIFVIFHYKNFLKKLLL